MPNRYPRISKEDVEKILKKDLANIIKTVNEGKPLSSVQRDIIADQLSRNPVLENPVGGRNLVKHSRGYAIGGKKAFTLDKPRRREFEELCATQCTQVEIMKYFGVTDNTLARAIDKAYGKTWAEVFAEFRTLGFISIRRAMFEKATIEKDTKMQIYLSKNWLGMSDSNSIFGEDSNVIVADKAAEVVVYMPQRKKPMSDGEFDEMARADSSRFIDEEI